MLHVWCWCLITATIWDKSMIKHKHIDLICIAAAVLAAAVTVLLMFGEQLGIAKASANPGYMTRLFDDNRVHTVDIQIEDWGAFIENAEREEYVSCTAKIDGEEFYHVGLRPREQFSAADGRIRPFSL